MSLVVDCILTLKRTENSPVGFITLRALKILKIF